MHQGMTSSDVLDTCLNVQLARAADLLIADVDRAARRAQDARASNTRTRSPSAAATASTPSRRPSASSSPTPTPSSQRARERLVAAREGSRDLRHLRRRRHLRQHRSAYRSLCRGENGPGAGAGLDADHSARPSRHVLRDPRRRRLQSSSGSRPRSGICSAPKCSKRRNSSRRARRARPPCRTSATRCSSENLTGLARMVRAYATPGDGECRALARARHLAFLASSA